MQLKSFGIVIVYVCQKLQEEEEEEGLRIFSSVKGCF